MELHGVVVVGPLGLSGSARLEIDEELPPRVVELYAKSPSPDDRARDPPPSARVGRLQRKAAAVVAVKQREMLEHHALDRHAPRPYKKDVMLQARCR